MANPENKQIPYESTQKDIRDAIESVATAIGGIAIPSADHVSYDNSGSGLSATDVQNAIDEIVSDIPTVNNGTLTIQQNGTSKGTFTANSASNVNVNIETPTADKKTATDQFTTADGGLLSKCQINLVPVQSGSGDPSPDNIRPISGHTEVDLQVVGKNLISGIENGAWNSNQTKNDTAPNRARTKTIFNIVPSSKVYLSLVPTSGKYIDVIIHGFTDLVSNRAWETSWTRVPNAFNIPNNIKYIDIIFRTSDSSNNPENYITNVQLEYGETATPYESYLGHLYQVQIGSTVYGGTVDLVSGVMNVTHGYVDLGSLAWTYTPDATRAFRSSSRLNNALLPATSNDKPSAICSALSVVDYVSMTTAVADLTIIWSGSSFYGQVWCDYPNITSANDFKTAVTGVMLVYELATPTTIQLTPQQIEALVGENNLSTPLDGQSIDSVKYREVFAFDDVEKVVSLRVPISMLGTDESGRTTASQSYASGDYFYKDGYMCKALTSISAGATLTLNTNYSQGTLADVLKAIENA